MRFGPNAGSYFTGKLHASPKHSHFWHDQLSQLDALHKSSSEIHEEKVSNVQTAREIFMCGYRTAFEITLGCNCTIVAAIGQKPRHTSLQQKVLQGQNSRWKICIYKCYDNVKVTKLICSQLLARYSDVHTKSKFSPTRNPSSNSNLDFPLLIFLVGIPLWIYIFDFDETLVRLKKLFSRNYFPTFWCSDDKKLIDLQKIFFID